MISIIIPSYSRATVLSGVIASLLNQTIFQKEACELIISIDHNDKERERYIDYLSQFKQIYQQYCPKVKLELLINETEGLVKAKNSALKVSKYDYIMMLDDDLILEPRYIERLYKDLIQNEGVGAVSGYIVTFKPAISHTQPSDFIIDVPVQDHLQTLNINVEDGKWRSVFGKKEQVMDWSKINNKLNQSKRYTMDYFVNSYMFKKSIALEIEGYNDDLNSMTSAHEEVDFTFRIKRAGYTLLFNPFIRMWHWTIGNGGIYKGSDWGESKKILEEEYAKSLPVFTRSISDLQEKDSVI